MRLREILVPLQTPHHGSTTTADHGSLPQCEGGQPAGKSSEPAGALAGHATCTRVGAEVGPRLDYKGRAAVR